MVLRREVLRREVLRQAVVPDYLRGVLFREIFPWSGTRTLLRGLPFDVEGLPIGFVLYSFLCQPCLRFLLTFLWVVPTSDLLLVVLAG